MTTTTGITIHDQNLEKQIEKHMGGCMAGFFNLFDRNHLLTGKRLYPKRLLPPTGESVSETVSIVGSPALPREFENPKVKQQEVKQTELRSPAPEKDVTPAATPAAAAPPPKSVSPVGASTFEFKEAVKSPWKFSREAPRLSLDSRAITDAKGGLRPKEIRINTASRNDADDEERENNQRRSPSVIARLMGLEPISSSSANSEAEPAEKKVELRRSASESRSRDYNQFFDTPSFLSPARNEAGDRKLDHNHHHSSNVINRQQQQQSNSNNGVKCKINNVKMMRNNHQQAQSNKSMVERRRYYDTADIFPQKEHHHQAVTIYGEIERRLRMRGIDEPSKDLETLKHILEALQLKGLLHSSSTSGASATGRSRHNVVYDRRDESPIVLMKPGNRLRSTNNVVSPRRERPARSSMRSPRGENRNSSTTVRRKGVPLSVETQRRGTEMGSTARNSHSPIQSPRTMKRSDNKLSQSPRSRRPTAEIYQADCRVFCGPSFAEDEVSTVSECSYSTSSHTDNERWRVEEYSDGRNLLDRCDKLLHSIAEITSHSAELQQPSPVSVLDSSFYKEDESSPSPVKKRTIHFNKDQAVLELEEEMWSPRSSTTQLLKTDNNNNDIDSSDDSEFSYVSEVLRASNYFPDDNSLFLLLEKQSSAGFNRDQTKVSILQRKLIFDTITEILDRNRQLPPWKAVSSTGKPMLEQIRSEFQRMRERDPSEDLFEVICGVLKKDLADDSVNGWGDCPVEMSEAVLDIERLIFKDLIGETIQDLATFAGKSAGTQVPRRKLVF